MTQPTEPARIAVLDMGKTRLKLLVASEDGWPLETRSIPNTANTSGPYLAYDLAGLEEWFLDTLAKAGIVHVGREHADDRAIAELKATGTAQPREESFHCLFVDSPIECYGILDSTAAILLKTSSRSGGKALSRLFRSRQDIRRLSDRAQSIQND